MIMNHYEEGINAMWEEVEGKKPESIHQPSDKERWKEFVEKYSHSGYLVQSEFGTIDTTDDAMKDVAGGENLSYSIYIDFQSYIKLTCQEIYFVEIYDLFNDKFGTHSIGDLSNEELLSWYDAISTIDLSNKKIVTFGNDLSNDVRNINRLITIRGRLMMALVKKNRQ